MTAKTEETIESLYEGSVAILNAFAGILGLAGLPPEELARQVFNLLKPILRAIFVIMVFGGRKRNHDG